MEQSTAVWFIIALALLTANLPFALQRSLLLLPWQQAGEPSRPFLLRWLESLLFFAVLAGVGWQFYEQISDMLVMGGGLASLSFVGLVAAFLVVCAALLALPGWRLRNPVAERSDTAQKPFVERLLEVFVLYLLCGTLAMALEQNIGNRFVQTWEFYAITGSLYAVLGYPGFVLRYLLRKPRRRRSASGGQARRGTLPAGSKPLEQPIGHVG